MNRFRRAAIRAAMKSEWFVRFAGRGRSEGPDEALDRQIAAALEYQRVARLPPLESLDPVAARAFAESNLEATELAPESMAEIIDTTLTHDRIPARIYVPQDAGKHWIVWCHGGGGVIGSIEGSDRVTRYLAEHTKCTVASVGYRLAPEDKHPAAIDDAVAAWEALTERMPAGARAAIGGDSFGGFLSVHVDRETRVRGLRQPDLQILVYPLVDMTLTQPSIDRYAEGYLLTKAMMNYFRDHYLNNADERQTGSPWFWKDVSGAAPAIISTAGYDPLVDEGNAWAERLAAAGVTVRHHCHPGLVHGFLSLAGIVRAAKSATDQICVEIVELLSE
ncbi:MAG TPA: alpha/beta hydrolase [Kofleriaceae bacterium]|nr:alpha/beta hydrolase [Kofleriaceae bacterium]